MVLSSHHFIYSLNKSILKNCDLAKLYILFSRNYSVMSQSESQPIEYSVFQKKCELLLQQPQIRFAGLINHMGNLVAGGFKEGITPLEDKAERRKMYMELVLRVSTRKEFDYSLGPVQYSASRRINAVMLSFPVNNKVLMVSAEPSVNIDDIAKTIMKLFGLD